MRIAVRTLAYTQGLHMASDTFSSPSRRGALKCLAFGGAGTLFTLSGGVFTPIDLAFGATDAAAIAKTGKPL